MFDDDDSVDLANEVLEDIVSEKNDLETVGNFITVGRWVFVKQSTKKLIKHFVGNVIDQTENGWVIKYTKPYKNFVRAVVDDTNTVDENGIIKLLPEPTVDRRGLLEFPVRFLGYNL